MNDQENLSTNWKQAERTGSRESETTKRIHTYFSDIWKRHILLLKLSVWWKSSKISRPPPSLSVNELTPCLLKNKSDFIPRLKFTSRTNKVQCSKLEGLLRAFRGAQSSVVMHAAAHSTGTGWGGSSISPNWQSFLKAGQGRTPEKQLSNSISKGISKQKLCSYHSTCLLYNSRKNIKLEKKGRGVGGVLSA